MNLEAKTIHDEQSKNNTSRPSLAVTTNSSNESIKSPIIKDVTNQIASSPSLSLTNQIASIDRLANYKANVKPIENRTIDQHHQSHSLMEMMPLLQDSSGKFITDTSSLPQPKPMYYRNRPIASAGSNSHFKTPKRPISNNWQSSKHSSEVIKLSDVAEILTAVTTASPTKDRHKNSSESPPIPSLMTRISNITSIAMSSIPTSIQIPKQHWVACSSTIQDTTTTPAATDLTTTTANAKTSTVNLPTTTTTNQSLVTAASSSALSNSASISTSVSYTNSSNSTSETPTFTTTGKTSNPSPDTSSSSNISLNTTTKAITAMPKPPSPLSIETTTSSSSNDNILITTTVQSKTIKMTTKAPQPVTKTATLVHTSSIVPPGAVVPTTSDKLNLTLMTSSPGQPSNPQFPFDGPSREPVKRTVIVVQSLPAAVEQQHHAITTTTTVSKIAGMHQSHGSGFKSMAVPGFIPLLPSTPSPTTTVSDIAGTHQSHDSGFKKTATPGFIPLSPSTLSASIATTTSVLTTVDIAKRLTVRGVPSVVKTRLKIPVPINKGPGNTTTMGNQRPDDLTTLKPPGVAQNRNLVNETTTDVTTIIGLAKDISVHAKKLAAPPGNIKKVGTPNSSTYEQLYKLYPITSSTPGLFSLKKGANSGDEKIIQFLPPSSSSSTSSVLNSMVGGGGGRNEQKLILPVQNITSKTQHHEVKQHQIAATNPTDTMNTKPKTKFAVLSSPSLSLVRTEREPTTSATGPVDICLVDSNGSVSSTPMMTGFISSGTTDKKTGIPPFSSGDSLIKVQNRSAASGISAAEGISTKRFEMKSADAAGADLSTIQISQAQQQEDTDDSPIEDSMDIKNMSLQHQEHTNWKNIDPDRQIQLKEQYQTQLGRPYHLKHLKTVRVGGSSRTNGIQPYKRRDTIIIQQSTLDFLNKKQQLQQGKKESRSKCCYNHSLIIA